MVQPTVKLGLPLSSIPAISTPSWRDWMAPRSSSWFMSFTVLASKWSPKAISSPRTTTTFWMPSICAERSSACIAILFRSRQQTWMTASIPCWCMRTPPPRALILIIPSPMSGIMTASTRPLIRRALVISSEISTPLGVSISAKTTNSPAANRFWKLMGFLSLPIHTCRYELYEKYCRSLFANVFYTLILSYSRYFFYFLQRFWAMILAVPW